jgi:hypothetical protein
MEQAAIIECFEKVLREVLGVDPQRALEDEGWWRFTIDGKEAQGGLHSADLRILCTLCEIDHEADLSAVYSDLKARNDALGAGSIARFIESDNYLHTRCLVPFDDLTPELIPELFAALQALSASPEASALRSRWRSW